MAKSKKYKANPSLRELVVQFGGDALKHLERVLIIAGSKH